MKKFALAGIASAMIATSANAAVTIDFESAQAGYTPTPGVTQEVTDQFGSLGVIFRDQKTPGRGATLGKCGPGNGAVSFFGFGSDFPGCGDTRPNIDVDFVNPFDNMLDGFTTSFSLLTTDGLIRLTAFDSMGTILGTTEARSGILSLSGIGNISRVNIFSVDNDPTTLDDFMFDDVIGIGGAVPEPATWAFMIFGFGAIGGALRRNRKANVKVSYA